LRGSVHYILSPKVQAGITTGINIRYLENYGASKNKTTVSIPVMGAIEYVLIYKDKIGLSVNAGIGHNFMNIKSGIYTDKGGITYQSGISFKKKKNYKGSVSYNIGYEHQTDNVSFIFPRSGSNTGFYNIKYKQFRNQLYFSVGFEF
jgi:queuine/archaeosine tRNA-ribosyltransferase